MNDHPDQSLNQPDPDQCPGFFHQVAELLAAQRHKPVPQTQRALWKVFQPKPTGPGTAFWAKRTHARHE